jgi:hypothetical protein
MKSRRGGGHQIISCKGSPLFVLTPPLTSEQAESVDYMQLPQPVKYEDIQREIMSERMSGGQVPHTATQCVPQCPRLPSQRIGAL